MTARTRQLTNLVVRCFFDQDRTSTCQYVVWDQQTRHAAILDSVLDLDINTGRVEFNNANRILEFVQSNKLLVKWILDTHIHADHLTASAYLKKRLSETNPTVCIGKGITLVQETFKRKYRLSDDFKTDGSQFDLLLQNDQILPLGNLEIRCLDTPGHTPDHMAYEVGDSVFVGDTLFMPEVGSARCDFPNGSAELLEQSVRNKIFTLNELTKIYVGHDYGRDEPKWVASVAEQKKCNIHLNTAISKEQFIQMRNARDAKLAAPKLLHFALQVNMRAGRFDGNELLVRIPITSEIDLS